MKCAARKTVYSQTGKLEACLCHADRQISQDKVSAGRSSESGTRQLNASAEDCVSLICIPYILMSTIYSSKQQENKNIFYPY
jgi:hypothetical protein